MDKKTKQCSDNPETTDMGNAFFELGKQLHKTWTDMDRVFPKWPKSPACIPTGCHSLDRIMGGLRPSELVVLGGRPRVGKTALALNIMECVASGKAMDRTPFYRDHARKHPVAIFSCDMSGTSLAQRMIGSLAGIPAYKIETGFPLSPAEKKQLVKAAKYLQGLPVFIEESNNITEIFCRVEVLKNLHGVECVILDNIQHLRYHLLARRGWARELNAIAIFLKSMTLELDIPVLALSQLACPRDISSKPTLADFRDSEAIERKADTILLLGRHCTTPVEAECLDTHLAVVDVAKNGNGSLGEVELTFDEEVIRFSDRF